MPVSWRNGDSFAARFTPPSRPRAHTRHAFQSCLFQARSRI
jgi:hypothetical protein